MANQFPDVTAFHFSSLDYDPVSGIAKLGYAFDDGEPLYEQIHFPNAPWPTLPSRQAALQQALELLHWVAGVSYYKTCLPASMDMGGVSPGPATAAFLRDVYVKGLGEFGWLNRVSVAEQVNFPAGAEAASAAKSLDLPERALVAMGGGKDSLVSLECLRAARIEQLPVCVGDAPLIGETVARSGLPLLRIGRQLSPRLHEMNRAGALNGHVPVTAIHCAILACAAILYGFRWVVFSNESSASEATLRDESGVEINHQYSKSVEFEIAFKQVLKRHVSPDLDCFSLLRPMSELAVASKFSELRQYHSVFSSCNRNFHVGGSRIEGRWCGNCPKCRFSCLALAGFLSPEELTAIQGVDLLDRVDQLEGFRALCGLGVDKPFECVGGIGESRSAMARLAQQPRWLDKAVVKALGDEVQRHTPAPLEHWLSSDGPHLIPERLWNRCRAFF